MSAQVAALIMTGLPILLALVLRINTALVFFSLASGVLLQKALGESATLALGGFIKNGQVEQIAGLTLLWLPLFATFVMARRSMRSSGFILQLLPLILASLAGTVFAFTLLSQDARDSLYQGFIGSQLYRAQDVIVAAAVILNLMVAWRLGRQHGGHDKHGKHHSKA